jgi:hypothetical protein
MQPLGQDKEPRASSLQAGDGPAPRCSALTKLGRSSSLNQAAERLADLKVQQANVDAQRARVTAEAGPALYLAKLFGSNNTEAMVRFITALLVWYSTCDSGAPCAVRNITRVAIVSSINLIDH